MTDNNEIALQLVITDRELCEALAEHPEGTQRTDFAITAMKIGVLALRQAQGRIDAEQIRAAGERLIEDFSTALNSHQEGVTERVASSLKDYFDPESGRFNDRVKRLIDKDGELERIIRSQVEGDGSALVKTLDAHTGKDSALMKMLDPQAADGVVKSLSSATEKTLSEQREQILNEFSLDNDQSALSRLVSELRKNNGDLMGAFDLNEEGSALKRLMDGVENAQRKITSEFSLDDENSALARMRKQLLEVFEQQGKENQEFQTEVRASLAAMDARRQEAQHGTRHGLDFEGAVFDFINDRSQKAGHIATHTGSAVGRVGRKLVGDVVIELGPEHSAAGSRIVVEAKENRSYRLAKVREDMQKARDNRDASVGIFVFSKSTAPEGLEAFSRYGNDIVVVWDKDDTGTDVFLDAGLSVAIALSVRAQAHADGVGADFEAIEQAILEIQKQADGLAQIKTWANTVRNNGDHIIKSAEKMQEGLNNQVEVLNDKVADLRVVVGDTAEVAAAA